MYGKRFQEEMLLKGQCGWILMTGGQSSVDQVRDVRRNLVIWETGSPSVGQSSASQGSLPEMQIPSLV